jgi:hypothetical protein
MLQAGAAALRSGAAGWQQRGELRLEASQLLPFLEAISPLQLASKHSIDSAADRVLAVQVRLVARRWQGATGRGGRGGAGHGRAGAIMQHAAIVDCSQGMLGSASTT